MGVQIVRQIHYHFMIHTRGSQGVIHTLYLEASLASLSRYALGGHAPRSDSNSVATRNLATRTMLNTVTIEASGRLYRYRDCLDCLNKAMFLSSLDINGAYHSIMIDEESRDLFTWVCHFGLYRWKRLPYGFKNSGPIFCRCVFETFLGLIYDIVSVYSDDSLIFGGIGFRMHAKCIALCINRCHQKGFRLSLDKCLFFRKEMDYLGCTAIVGGTKPCKRNVEKIQAIVVAKVKDVRSFVGLSNYYRRFVKGYANVVAPLLKYLCKDARLPKPLPADVDHAIQRIKDAITSYPILRNPEFKRQFILETDGSLKGFGAILKQVHDGVEHIVAYGSSHIIKSQLKYTSDMLELVAAVWGMKHFHHYLRNHFILKTDNVILKWLRGKQVDVTKTSLAKWILIAQAYEFTIVHVPGRQLVGADLMSRAGATNSSVDPLLVELENQQYFRVSIGKQHAKQALKWFKDTANVYHLGEVRKDVLKEGEYGEVRPLCKDVWKSEQDKDIILGRALTHRVNIKFFFFFFVVWSNG